MRRALPHMSSFINKRREISTVASKKSIILPTFITHRNVTHIFTQHKYITDTATWDTQGREHEIFIPEYFQPNQRERDSSRIFISTAHKCEICDSPKTKMRFTLKHVTGKCLETLITLVPNFLTF